VNEIVELGLRLVRGTQSALATSREKPIRSHPVDDASSIRATHEAPTAFVSWAHSHSTWSKTQTSDWESAVATFAAVIRRLGIQADVDLFHLDEPQDWTRYGPQQILKARFTLVVMSEAWAERWNGTNSPVEGAGAAAEADTLRGLFSRDQREWQSRVIVVMLPGVDSGLVPPDLHRVTRVPVDPTDPDSFDGLIRLLTEQPRYPKPPVGRIPILSPASGYQESSELSSLRERLSTIEQRKKQLGNRRSQDADTERARLELRESATRGFIDAELTIED